MNKYWAAKISNDNNNIEDEYLFETCCSIINPRDKKFLHIKDSSNNLCSIFEYFKDDKKHYTLEIPQYIKRHRTDYIYKVADLFEMRMVFLIFLHYLHEAKKQTNQKFWIHHINVFIIGVL